MSDDARAPGRLPRVFASIPRFCRAAVCKGRKKNNRPESAVLSGPLSPSPGVRNGTLFAPRPFLRPARRKRDDICARQPANRRDGGAPRPPDRPNSLLTDNRPESAVLSGPLSPNPGARNGTFFAPRPFLRPARRKRDDICARQPANRRDGGAPRPPDRPNSLLTDNRPESAVLSGPLSPSPGARNGTFFAPRPFLRPVRRKRDDICARQPANRRDGGAPRPPDRPNSLLTDNRPESAVLSGPLSPSPGARNGTLFAPRPFLRPVRRKRDDICARQPANRRGRRRSPSS